MSNSAAPFVTGSSICPNPGLSPGNFQPSPFGYAQGRLLRDYEGPNFHSSIDGSRRRGLGVAWGHHRVRAGHSSRVLDLVPQVHAHSRRSQRTRASAASGKELCNSPYCWQRATSCVGAFAVAADQLLCRRIQQRHSRRQRIRDRDRRSRLSAEVDRGDAVGQLRVGFTRAGASFRMARFTGGAATTV